MRISLSWLKDFVTVDATPSEIAGRLIGSGTEVESLLTLGVKDIALARETFVIGRVLEFDKHPNADRLRLCIVDAGEDNPRQIVCGAANFAAGDTVVLALPGAVLPGADAPLKEAKLRGEVSQGMMLSERELGLSDDHDGIIVLPDHAGYDIGSALADHIALDEVVLDLSVESNRGDCLSVYGIAREVATLFDLPLAPMPGSEPAPASALTDDLVRIGIDDPDRCPRFTARGFRGVTVGPSPLRVRQRLSAAGIRPISNVVDATNYVMHELGSPLHVYDADRIAGGVLVARRAAEGESVATLDGRSHALTSDMLVIADADGPSGIAGVMGGAASEIRPETRDVVLEAACFERSGIQRTGAMLGIRTDSSNRFEKGVSPHLPPLASVRAAELIVSWAGGEMLGGAQDIHGALPAREQITLRDERPAAVLGMDVPAEDVQRILDGLGFDPVRETGSLRCQVPYWRWLDVTREIDLVEEIGRVHGLDAVRGALPPVPPGLGGLSSAQDLRQRIADHLAGAGLREVVTLSLVDPGSRSRFGLVEQAVPLADPLSADLSELRSSLVPSLIDVLRRNAAVGQRDLQIFEVGRTHHGEADGVVESESLGIALSGAFGGQSWTGAAAPCDLALGIAVVDVLLRRLGVEATRSPVADVTYLHPGRAARIYANGVTIGIVGELHPALVRELDLPGPMVVAELGLEPLLREIPSAVACAAIPAFPPVLQDIAVIVDDAVPAADLIAEARSAGGAALATAEIFDVFADADRLGTGRSSVGLRFAFQADDRTLTEEEASAVRTRIVEALAARFGAELRG